MKYKNRLLLVLSLLVLLACGAWLYKWWNEPSLATNTAQTTASWSDVLGSQTTLQKWQTDYFMTLIPSNLQVKTNYQNSSAPIEGSYLLDNIDSSVDDQVGVTVGNIGNGTLQETSAVKLRLNDPADYHPVSVNYAPPDSIAFNKVGSNELSVFWQYGNRYAAVVVGGTSIDQTDMSQIAANIISNWQWNKQ